MLAFFYCFLLKTVVIYKIFLVILVPEYRGGVRMKKNAKLLDKLNANAILDCRTAGLPDCRTAGLPA